MVLIFVLHADCCRLAVITVLVAGSKFKLESPHGAELPSRGFDSGEDTYQRPPESGGQLTVKVDAGSDRLQLLTPFDKWDGNDIEDMTVLMKVTSCSSSCSSSSSSSSHCLSMQGLEWKN